MEPFLSLTNIALNKSLLRLTPNTIASTPVIQDNRYLIRLYHVFLILNYLVLVGFCKLKPFSLYSYYQTRFSSRLCLSEAYYT
jgi:hypothetical protein